MFEKTARMATAAPMGFARLSQLQHRPRLPWMTSRCCLAAKASPNFNFAWNQRQQELSTTPTVTANEDVPPPPTAPSFTTGENFARFIKAPTMDIIANICFLGVANNPRTRSNLDVTEFSEGALHAVEVVTSSLSKGEVLGDQLTPACLSRLSTALSSVAVESKTQLEVLKEDVFFSWIGDVDKDGENTKVLFVTMSLRKFAQIKRDFEENTRRSKAFMDNLQERKPEAEEAKKMVEEFRASLSDPYGDFRSADFLVSNFVFVCKDGRDWQIDELAMRPGKELYNSLYHFRCKGRIGFTLRGIKYSSVLRYDYLSDMFIVTIFIAILMSRGSTG